MKEKILAVSAMIKNTNALKALGKELTSREHDFVLAATTKHDDLEMTTILNNNIATADIVIVGLGSDNSPWGLEKLAADQVCARQKLVMITDWPGSIQGRTKNRFPTMTLERVNLVIVPHGDGWLAKEVCPNAVVLETHHPDIEEAETVGVSRERIREALTLLNEASVVITGTKTREINDEVLRLVQDARNQLPEFRFVFLCHPGEQGLDLDSYRQKFGGIMVLAPGFVIDERKMSSDDFLPGADFFLNIASTSVERAGFLRVPTLWAQTPKVREMLKKNSGTEVPSECEGEDLTALPVSDGKALAEHLNALQADKEYAGVLRNMERRYPLPTPKKGTAAKNMADAIEALNGKPVEATS